MSNAVGLWIILWIILTPSPVGIGNDIIKPGLIWVVANINFGDVLCYSGSAAALSELVEHGTLICLPADLHADASQAPLRGQLLEGLVKVLIDGIGKQSFALDVFSALVKHSKINREISL